MVTSLEKVNLSDSNRILLPVSTINCEVEFDLFYDSCPYGMNIAIPIYGRYVGIALDIIHESTSIFVYLLAETEQPHDFCIYKDHYKLVELFKSAEYFLVAEVDFSRPLPKLPPRQKISTMPYNAGFLRGWLLSKDDVPEDLLPRND